MSKPTVEIRESGIESGWVIDIQKHYGIPDHIMVVSQWSGGLQVVKSEEEMEREGQYWGQPIDSTIHNFCPHCGRPAVDVEAEGE